MQLALPVALYCATRPGGDRLVLSRWRVPALAYVHRAARSRCSGGPPRQVGRELNEP